MVKVERNAPGAPPGVSTLSVLTIDEHAKAFEGLARPTWLVDSDLIDTTWNICAGRSTAKRRSICTITFDAVVAPGARRLTDPEHQADLITAKMILYLALRPVERGGITSSNGLIQAIVREYCTYVRWRLSRGIPSNRQLTREWFEEYLDALRHGGTRGCLPMASRWQAYLAELNATGRSLPVRIHNGRRYLAINRVAQSLGLETALGLPPDVRKQVLEHAESSGIKTNPRPWAQRATVQPGRRPQPSLLEEKVGWTQNRLNLTLRPIELLYRFNSSLTHDPLSFDPFEGHRTMAAVARTMGLKDAGDRTPTAPAYQTCYLVDQALTWVFTYSAEVLSFADALAAKPKRGGKLGNHLRARRVRRLARLPKFRPAVEASSPWPVREANTKDPELAKRPPFREVLFDLLPGACMVVIAAFSARRLEEIDSLRAGCISADEGDVFLETWISKTLRRYDKIPVPRSVAQAVSVLESLSESWRERTQAEWIFAFDDPVPGPRRQFDARRALARFVEHVSVPPLPSGEAWWFTPHQFRRFFGVVYFHHYRFPNLAALSRYYRHFDPDMTRRYITESALGGFLEFEDPNSAAARRARRDDRDRLNMFQASGLEFRVERYSAIALGLERATGFGGDFLTRELDELVREASAQVEIGTVAGQAKLDELILAFAEGRKLEPHPMGHSYCKCTSDARDLEAAGCLRERTATLPDLSHRSTPDPAFATDQTCSRCPHNVQLPENEPYWRELVRHEKAQAKCSLGPLMLALANERVEMAEQHCARCFDAK